MNNNKNKTPISIPPPMRFLTGFHLKTHSKPGKSHSPAPLCPAQHWDHHHLKQHTELSFGPAQDPCAGTLTPFSPQHPSLPTGFRFYT